MAQRLKSAIRWIRSRLTLEATPRQVCMTMARIGCSESHIMAYLLNYIIRTGLIEPFLERFGREVWVDAKGQAFKSRPATGDWAHVRVPIDLEQDAADYALDRKRLEAKFALQHIGNTYGKEVAIRMFADVVGSDRHVMGLTAEECDIVRLAVKSFVRFDSWSSGDPIPKARRKRAPAKKPKTVKRLPKKGVKRAR